MNTLPFSPDALVQAVVNKAVTVRKHPDSDLFIYNYTPEVQYRRDWNPVTKTCRGLIMDIDGNVVSRPWEKFFNLSELADQSILGPLEVTDKKDGSLGILYHTEEVTGISTRGSFESEQSNHATSVFMSKYVEQVNLDATRHYTFLFEIIYPENRIVLDYQGMDDLVLLGAVIKEDGRAIGPLAAQQLLNWNGPVTEVFSFSSCEEVINHLGRANAEGYVVRTNNLMFKVKQQDYLALHRLVTGASPLRVWEQLRAGMKPDEIVSAFPDEFHEWVASMVKPLVDSFYIKVREIHSGFEDLIEYLTIHHGKDFDRKAFAIASQNYRDKKFFFSLLDGRDIVDSVWNELRPRGD